MESRLIVSVHYNQPQARSILACAFKEQFAIEEMPPAFICIGSDRHLLDCLGPMTGTMLEEKTPGVLVMGTLDHPWHAGNIGYNLREFRNTYPPRTVVAIDASIGEDDPPGLIKLKHGPIKPGKAVQKNLPGVGDYSITALVGNRDYRPSSGSIKKISLAHVYGMARVISDAIVEWHRGSRGQPG